MNSIQAKQIPIENYLQSISCYPVSKSGHEYFYLSPLHTENNASFTVSSIKNCWYDHALGTGGNLIDFVILYNKCSVGDALNIISLYDSSKITFTMFRQSDDFNNLLEIKKIKHLENRVLIQYITERKISLQIAAKYLKETYYNHDNKNYFALCFRNDKNGYELRNKYFKGGTSPKYITTFQKPFTGFISQFNNDNSLNLFEGFFDFLSALTYYKTANLKHSTIVLNSLAFLKEINFSKYQTINLFLDNDNAGNEAKYFIKHNFEGKIYDYSKIYADYKDFNEYLKNN